jgi:hypothetical protein
MQLCDRNGLPGESFANRYCVSQELGAMYDYLAKIILLGPSGAGKSVIQLLACTTP